MFHSLERTHATIALELTAIIYYCVTRTLLCSCYERTDHHTTATSSYGLHDVTRVTQTTISDERHVSALQCAVHIIYRTQLRYTYTCNDTSGTDTTRADTYLHCVSTVVNEHLRSLTGSDVTYYYIDVRE